jgi:hypothetical protein
MYGYPYKKATRIWTNLQHWTPKPMCSKLTPCKAFAESKCHQLTAQRGPGRKGGILDPTDKCSLAQLYSIPKELCDELATAFGNEV